MNKLIVVIMGPGKEHFLNMCLDSVKDAEETLYWTSNKEFAEKIQLPKIFNIHTFFNGWDESDSTTNGKCRQKYLDYLKVNYPNDWCLVLDEDEIVEDLQKVKDFINQPDREPGLYNVKMRHIIGNLGWEDNTNPVHVVPCRLFKISEAKGYPLHSHPILEGKLAGACLKTTIWHLGHLSVEYMDYILHRYHQHSNDSIIHTPQFLNSWKMAHLLGMYPVKQIDPLEIPKQLLNRYEIDADELYHSRYKLEIKHPIMVKQWQDFFKPESVLDLGCGRGCYLYFWKWFDFHSTGIDLSKWVVKNAFCSDIIQGDITEEKYYHRTFVGKNSMMEHGWDLITVIDVLEHLTEEQLDKVLKNMSKNGRRFLFSIPFEGDPNLEYDKTHIIKENKEWWVRKLSEYFTIQEAPQDWSFHNQILIGNK